MTPNLPVPLGMNSMMPQYQDGASDTTPTQNNMSSNIDEDDVKQCVVNDFDNDCKDKEEQGWVQKREYDLKAYYGIKDAAMSQRPWPGASNYPVPITPTLVDTGWANLKASMKAPDGKMVQVAGVGEEDIRKAIPLEALLNWQVTNDIPMDREQDKNIFRTLLHGTGMFKVIQDFNRNRVKVISFDVENFYIPIDAEDVQFEENNGHCTQIIPLSRSDIEDRKELGVYKDLDRIMPGARLSRRQGTDSLVKLKDYVSGTNKEQRQNRETYFLAETYKEYRPKSGSGYGDYGSSTRAGVRPINIIVWWSPNGSTIHRIAINEDGIVPFAKYDLYPNPGYFFSMSLPEKIRNIQEKANYADKQNTDALDRAISPAGFVDDTEALFATGQPQRVPGGIYPKGKGNKIEWEPTPVVERGFERQYQTMWVEAQQLSGLIDISYGQPTKDQTLGQTQIRTYRADIRFASIVARYGEGFKDTMDLIYHYDNKFMPTETKIKVVGYADYMKLSEIFPDGNGRRYGLGIEGKFDFSIGGSAVTEVQKQIEDKKLFYSTQLAMPDVIQNPATAWKMRNELAELQGIRDFETVMTKPKEALILSAQEAVQRVISGQTDVQMRPGIDTDSYIFEIELTMRSEMFQGISPEGQQALMKMRQIAYVMRAAEMQAQQDLMLIQQRQQADQQASAQAQAISQQAQSDAQRQNGREPVAA